MGMYLHDAGVVVWSVLIFGFLGLAASARYAWAPRRELLAVVAGLALATMLLGVLTTVLGVQISAQAAVTGGERMPIFVEGLREALNNFVLALGFAIVDVLVATYGTVRLARLSRALPA